MTEVISGKLNTSLREAFQHTPTSDQDQVFSSISKFLTAGASNEVFLLKGYAGTGKTSMIKSLVTVLPRFKLRVVLLAPTGRAAKVMAQYTSKSASTIHRHIYRLKSGGGHAPGFTLKENKYHDTVFVVDEASMIGDEAQSTAHGLLSDLLHYVNNGARCRLIMVGDVGQLPPVGEEHSPALTPDYLRRLHNVEAREVLMTQVMRQDLESSILTNATRLREQQRNMDFSVPELITGGEVHRLEDGYSVEDALNDSYRKEGREGTIIIVRSNKRANLYNQQIRQRILWQEERISSGDFLMVVKNNYFWLPDGSKAGFIANGDILELLEIYEIRELYGFEFARGLVKLIDYPEQAPFETVLNLKTLDIESASLSWQDMQSLYARIEEDFIEIRSKYKRRQKIKENPYYNALQVKFSYAITAHKSQGGQWQNVFVEKPWLPAGQPKLDDLRWLYTAFTRAQSNLYLLGFGDEYF